MITGFGSIDTAVEAMKEGAFDFIEKPVRRHNILKVVEKAFENISLIMENRLLKKKLAQKINGNEESSIVRSDSEEADYIKIKLGLTMEEIEREVIKKTLEYTNENKEIAAKILGIGLNSLIKKLKETEHLS